MKDRMTVRDLIKHLQKFDQDLPVCSECFDHTYEHFITEKRVGEGFFWVDKKWPNLVMTDEDKLSHYEENEKYEKAQKAVLIFV